MKYRFYLDSKEVFPIFGNGQGFIERGFSGRKYKLRDLIEDVTFDSLSFNYVESQNSEHQFFFEVLRDGVSKYVGTFTKVNCFFNRNEKHVKCKVKSFDTMQKFIDGLTQKYSVKDLNIANKTVNFTKYGLLQLYSVRSRTIQNITKSVKWEIPMPSDGYNYQDLLASGFGDPSQNPVFVDLYVTGVNASLTVDVSGRYNLISGNRQDGGFNYETTGATGSRKLVINAGGGGVVYESEILVEDQIDENDNARFTAMEGILLTHVSNGEKIKMYFGYIFARFFSDQDLTGVGTFESEPFDRTLDIFDDPPNYRFVTPIQVLGTIYSEETNTTNSERLGQYTSDALFSPNLYFKKPTGITNEIYPVSPTTWKELGIFAEVGFNTQSLVENVSSVIQIANCHLLGDVIKAFLDKIGGGIAFDKIVAHSRFLYDNGNPITGLANPTYLICQKGNVISKVGDVANLKDTISLSDIMEMLSKALRLDYYFDDANFILEHINFFENGGVYAGQEIGVNLRAIQELRTSKEWAFGLDAYDFESEKIPELIQTGWDDESTSEFDGVDIEINSIYTTAGSPEDRKVNYFTTNIEEASASPSKYSKDYFFLFSATLLSGDVYQLNTETIPVIGGGTGLIQNADLSFYILQDRFHRHGLPAANVSINGATATVLSQLRTKRQIVKFRKYDDVDTLKLIETNLGVGEIKELKRFFSSEIIEIIVNHDLD